MSNTTLTFACDPFINDTGNPEDSLHFSLEVHRLYICTNIGVCISTEEDDEQDADSDPLGIVLAWSCSPLRESSPGQSSTSAGWPSYDQDQI